MRRLPFPAIFACAVPMILVGLQLYANAQAPDCNTAGSYSQGSRTCSVNATTHCATTGCGSLVVAQICMVCQTSTSEATSSICESTAPAGCTVNVSLHCNDDKSQASFGYACDPNGEAISTTTSISCPVECQNCSTSERVVVSSKSCVACPSPQVSFQSNADDWRQR